PIGSGAGRLDLQPAWRDLLVRLLLRQHIRLACLADTLVWHIPPYTSYASAARAPMRHETPREDAMTQTLCDLTTAIGSSPGWQAILSAVVRVAPTEATVLLQGESGTGKEVVARLIHESSPRRSGPFVAVNCGALPEQLLESELFGYERGAFTGAQQSKPGLIESAAHGVLFLDEITEMSLAAQVKLLRFLQEREYQRLGGTRLQKADVRIVAATNRDVAEAVERGTFRQDLLYRLQVFDIVLPPLRERAADIPLLAEHFLAEFAHTMKRRPVRLMDDACRALLTHDWPGNVRELRNVLERAAILSDGDIDGSHVSFRTKCRIPPPAVDLRTTERITIERALQDTAWNKSQAARRL